MGLTYRGRATGQDWLAFTGEAEYGWLDFWGKFLARFRSRIEWVDGLEPFTDDLPGGRPANRNNPAR